MCSTRDADNEERRNVIHVAAPIVDNGKMIGVRTSSQAQQHVVAGDFAKRKNHSSLGSPAASPVASGRTSGHLVDQPFAMRVQSAPANGRTPRLPVTKSLDAFDFIVIPSLKKSLALELARCEWIDKCENVIVLGPLGVGKTHTALVLELAAFRKGHSVACTTAAVLLHELIEVRDEKWLRALQK